MMSKDIDALKKQYEYNLANDTFTTEFLQEFVQEKSTRKWDPPTYAILSQVTERTYETSRSYLFSPVGDLLDRDHKFSRLWECKSFRDKCIGSQKLEYLREVVENKYINFLLRNIINDLCNDVLRDTLLMKNVYFKTKELLLKFVYKGSDQFHPLTQYFMQGIENFPLITEKNAHRNNVENQWGSYLEFKDYHYEVQILNLINSLMAFQISPYTFNYCVLLWSIHDLEPNIRDSYLLRNFSKYTSNYDSNINIKVQRNSYRRWLNIKEHIYKDVPLDKQLALDSLAH